MLNSSIQSILQYRDIHDFWRQHNLPSRRCKIIGCFWRLADMSIGEFRGLPRLRGVAVATDGVLLLAKDSNGRLIEGHLANWIRDKRATESGASACHRLKLKSNPKSLTKAKSAKLQRLEILLEEFT